MYEMLEAWVVYTRGEAEGATVSLRKGYLHWTAVRGTREEYLGYRKVDRGPAGLFRPGQPGHLSATTTTTSPHLLRLKAEPEVDPVVHVPQPEDVVELAVHVHDPTVAEPGPLEDLRAGRVPSRQVVLSLVRLRRFRRAAISQG